MPQHLTWFKKAAARAPLSDQVFHRKWVDTVLTDERPVERIAEGILADIKASDLYWRNEIIDADQRWNVLHRTPGTISLHCKSNNHQANLMNTEIARRIANNAVEEGVVEFAVKILPRFELIDEIATVRMHNIPFVNTSSADLQGGAVKTPDAWAGYVSVVHPWIGTHLPKVQFLILTQDRVDAEQFHARLAAYATKNLLTSSEPTDHCQWLTACAHHMKAFSNAQGITIGKVKRTATSKSLFFE